MPLAAKKVKERPLVIGLTKEDTSRRRQLKELEEKENRVLRKERKKEQASYSWRRSVAVASRK